MAPDSIVKYTDSSSFPCLMSRVLLLSAVINMFLSAITRVAPQYYARKIRDVRYI